MQVTRRTATSRGLQIATATGVGCFTTHILNIGTLDYRIGVPSRRTITSLNGAIATATGHKGYAKYDLFTLEGVRSDWVQKRILCRGPRVQRRRYRPVWLSSVGISAGCGDIYGSGLSCQWIDVPMLRTAPIT